MHALKIYAVIDDVFVSCSVESPNLKNAMKYCKKNISTIMFTDRSKKNSLVQMNKTGINFWVDSNDYNIIKTFPYFYLLWTILLANLFMSLINSLF